RWLLNRRRTWKCGSNLQTCVVSLEELGWQRSRSANCGVVDQWIRLRKIHWFVLRWCILTSNICGLQENSKKPSLTSLTLPRDWQETYTIVCSRLQYQLVNNRPRYIQSSWRRFKNTASSSRDAISNKENGRL